MTSRRTHHRPWSNPRPSQLLAWICVVLQIALLGLSAAHNHGSFAGGDRTTAALGCDHAGEDHGCGSNTTTNHTPDRAPSHRPDQRHDHSDCAGCLATVALAGSALPEPAPLITLAVVTPIEPGLDQRAPTMPYGGHTLARGPPADARSATLA